MTGEEMTGEEMTGEVTPARTPRPHGIPLLVPRTTLMKDDIL